VSVQCSIRKIIEFTLEHVGLDLTVPGIRVELTEPLAEGGEFLRSEGANLVFEPFDLAHSGLRRTMTEFIVAGTPLQQRRWFRDDLLYSLYVHPQTYRSLIQAREFMRHVYGRPVSLPDVAAQANLSPYHFLRVYKRAYGETPHEFLTRLRIEKAKTLLARGSHNVTEACFDVRFSSLGSFSNLFAYRVGLPPSEYRRFARSMISVPSTVRSLFVPSCFFTMLYGTREERNFREAGRLEPMVSSGQRTETGR
jgi:AraC-like DNA-binding protein